MMLDLFFLHPYSFSRFPNDEKTLGIDQQFLIGRAILVSPNLVSVSANVDNILTLKIL